MAGVKPPSIDGAAKSGKVAKERNGTIDPNRPVNAAYLQEHHHSVGGKTTVLTKQKPIRSVRGRQNLTLINADHVNVGTEEDPDNQDAVELSQEEKRQKVIKLQLENAAKRSELIARSIVRQWVMRFYSVIASMFRNLSGRIMPELLAEFRSAANDDEAMAKGSEVLDKAVYEGLNQIQKSMMGFKEIQGTEFKESEVQIIAREKPRQIMSSSPPGAFLPGFPGLIAPSLWNGNGNGSH